MFVLQRLISRSSRSLAVMIGFGGSANAAGRESLRGSPCESQRRSPHHPSPSSSRSSSFPV